MLLILDMQEGLYGLSRDFDATLYRDSMIAHAAIGQVFDIPVVMTTSSQAGSCISNNLVPFRESQGGLLISSFNTPQAPMALSHRRSWTCIRTRH